MTLVQTENIASFLPIMLSVQQQQHHIRHQGLHVPVSSAGVQQQIHRGNVIVSTGTLTTGSDVKMALQQQQQQQQQLQQGCKRSKMYQTTPYGTVPHQPASVARRNARERNRVKQVNNGFAKLRQHIPQSVAQALGGNTAGTHGGARAGSKKLSKVETLRMAVEYIRSLQLLLDDQDGSEIVTLSSQGSPNSSRHEGDHHLDHLDHHDHLDHLDHHDHLDRHDNLDHHNHHNRGHHHHHHHQQHSPIEMRLHAPSEIGSDLGSHQQHHLRQNASPGFAATPCSEASSSPTPSFVSEASSAGSQGYGTSSTVTLYAPPTDAYDMYEPNSPEDEELLDCISWWQQSQG
ncbi:achaete-scute complex protein T3-like [Leptopilina heterotoma]|uniref:achaete-scute complex protein T3-like n=1 Tax=Leptopilina heterotoma TaxID=63436 RepID=UPI001CA82997|nr:achaete-scute complex protein T3-like [Leptopilina heterotoma]